MLGWKGRMVVKESNLSGGRRGNWDLKGRDLAAEVVWENVYLVVVVVVAVSSEGFGRQAASLVVEPVGERPDLGTVADSVLLIWCYSLGLALLLALRL